MKSSKITSWIFPIPILFLVSLLHLYPLLGSFSTKLPFPQIGDVNLTLTILQSNVHYILTGQWSQIYHLPMFFPVSYSMTLCFPIFGQSFLALPFFMLGFDNIYVLYNLFTIFCYVMCGWGAFLLIRDMTRTAIPALIAACLYTLLPFRVANIPHLNLLFHFSIPFCFLFLYRFLRESRIRDLLLFNAFLLTQFLFDLSIGFYLSIALGFFYLFGLFILRPPLKTNLLRLLPSLAGVSAVVLLFHYPFVFPGISHSPFGNSFGSGQYILSRSFYSGQSYFLNLFHGQWGNRPYFPGYTAALFFLLAFVPHLRLRTESWLMGTASLALLSPALMLLFVERGVPSPSASVFFDVPLALFVFSLAGLLFLIRRRIQPALWVVTAAYLAVIFISFEPFGRFFNLFGFLARFLPFLARARGAVRTMYVFPLLALAVMSFGLSHFLARRKRPLVWTSIIILLLAAESLRWPVRMGRLSDPGNDGREMYRLIHEYPQQSGLLELPFLAKVMNIYPLFTRFHHKHTYHGHHFFYSNQMRLENRPELNVENGYAGLKEPGFVRFLVERRLRIILLLRSQDLKGGLWREVERTIAVGESLGLYERVVKNPRAILLILKDRLVGNDFQIYLPRFFFTGKRAISFRVTSETNQPVTVEFNGQSLQSSCGGSTSVFWRIPLGRTGLLRHQNVLSAKCPDPIVLEDIRLVE